MNAGMKGEQAGTTLRGALLGLLDPSEENSKLMEKMGIAITDNEGNFVGLSNLVKNLDDSMAGMTDTQKAANLSALVGREAVSGMLTLMKAGPETINEMTKSLENSKDASAKAAAKMKDNLGGALLELEGAFETFMITIGTALTPAIQWVVNLIRNMINVFNEMPSGMQTALAILAALTAGFLLFVGPLLILLAVIPSIVAGFTAIAGVVGLTASALLSIIGVVVAVVAGVALLIAGLVLAYNKIEWFRNMVNAAWEWIKNATMVAFNFVKQIVMQIVSAIVAFAGEQLAKFGALWDKHGAFIMSTVRTYFSLVKDYIQIVMAVIKGIFQTVWPILSNIVKIAWGLIKTIVGSAIDVVVGLIDAAMSILQGDWKGAWSAIKGIAEDIWHNIESFFKGIDLAQIGKDIIQGLINGMGGMIGSVKSKVKEIAGKIPDGVKSLLNIHSPSRVMRELGGYTAEGLAIGLGDGISDVERASANMARAAIPNIGAGSYGASVGAGNSMTSSAGSGSKQPAIIQLVLPDGRVLAEASHDDMQRLFANSFSQELRVNGVKG
ncbi:phage tail tape measure protein [Rossellomorea sp. FS2]|uniref:phage tail tape measure protein n=1 Tax=Rossellomorea sp. FS2 TaxID=3391447 RepID=UPI003A4E5B15